MEEGREEEGVLDYFPVRIVLLDWCRIIYKIDLSHIYISTYSMKKLLLALLWLDV